MLAVDTNIVVRYIVGDDPEQSGRARALVRDQAIWVSTTVLLETAWVLRKTYGYKPGQIAWALRLFAGLPTVTLQEADRVAIALGWLDKLDVADALHLAQSDEAEALLTFDQRPIRGAAGLGAVPVREP